MEGMRRLGELVRRPEFGTELLHILKGVIAATAAWWLSLEVLDSMLPFLAPWTALLTVQATVHRSLSRGAQTTVASAISVGLSFMIGAYLGVSVWTFALALLIGLAGARLSWIRDEGVAIATTAIFVLGSGFSQQQPLLGPHPRSRRRRRSRGPRQSSDHPSSARSAGLPVRGQPQPPDGRRPHQHGR